MGLIKLVRVGLAAAAVLASTSAWASTITVTLMTDTNAGGLVGTGPGNAGDLRAAMLASGAGDTIVFSGCSIAVPCTIALGGPLPPLVHALTIDGGTTGAVVIDGSAGNYRAFFADTGVIAINNLVVQNVKVVGGDGGSGGGGGGLGAGAGLFVNNAGAHVSLANVLFKGCSAAGGVGGGPGGYGSSGGGGLAFGSASDLAAGGGGVLGAGASGSFGYPNGTLSGGAGGEGGGGGGVFGAAGASSVGYATNPGGAPGSGSAGGAGGFGGGGGGAENGRGGAGGFGGGGGGGNPGGNGGFGGGGGGGGPYTSVGVGGTLGGSASDGGGGGGGAAGPCVFVNQGSLVIQGETRASGTILAVGGGGGPSIFSQHVAPQSMGTTPTGQRDIAPVYLVSGGMVTTAAGVVATAQGDVPNPFAPPPPPPPPVTRTVTLMTDASSGGLAGTGPGNAGDLRATMLAAGVGDTITFSGCSAAAPCTVRLGGPLPPIIHDLVIDGGAPGAVNLDGSGGNYRAFFVDTGAVALNNLVIQNVKVVGGAGGLGSGGGGLGAGAGLFVNNTGAHVSLANVAFKGCSATGGQGGAYGNYGAGGGGGMTFASLSDDQGADGGGGMLGPGHATYTAGGIGGAGGGGGGVWYNTTGPAGVGYATNLPGFDGMGWFSGGDGGFGGGGGGGVAVRGGNGGFGGGGGGGSNGGGNGGFGGGGGGDGGVGGTLGGSAAGLVSGGGGGGAAGPCVFVNQGSLTILGGVNASGTIIATGGGSGGVGGGGLPQAGSGTTPAGATDSAPIYLVAGGMVTTASGRQVTAQGDVADPFTPPAIPLLNRTYVSALGDDGADCSLATPCQTFAAALSATGLDGEVDCLTPGESGSVTITQSVTIICRGMTAGVMAPGASGIVVNLPATGRVQLIGLDLNGAATGLDGVRMTGGGALTIQDCLISGFRSGASAGVRVAGASGAHVLIENSVIHANDNGVVIAPAAGTNSLTIDRSTLEGNGVANLVVAPGATAVLSNSALAGAPNAIRNTGGAVISYGNNFIRNAGGPTQTLPRQ